MSTNLTISPDASLPDRGKQGLRLSFEPGNDGSYLLHPLTEDAPVLHVRVMLAPATATGGAVRVAGGHDAAGAETWWLDYDADQRAVRLELATGQAITAALNALPWHCVEVGIDTSAGVAGLWVNGLTHDTLDGDFADLVTRSTWLGGVFKGTALAGAVYLDEWVIDAAYIGPVLVEPAGEHADDPRRWLVIYNAAMPDAVTWAEAYRQARGVPFANLLGLSLPTQETIDGAAYAALATAVNDYLASSGLDRQVMGVLVGYGVPGYVDFGYSHLEAVPALMHSAHLDATLTANPAAGDVIPGRPRYADLDGLRMTARIDGPTLAAALALIERADAQISDGLGDGAGATLWFDPFAGEPGSSYDWWKQRMIAWAGSVDRQRLRLPWAISGDADDPDQPEVTFASINRDAFFWGWPAPQGAPPSPDFFAEPAGPRVCCVQLHPFHPTATTLRSATPNNWVDSALAAGYAAAVGTSRQCSLSNTPYVRPFFEALRRGWTLAEAWYVALPIQREGQHLVGDPLLRTRFPAAGWDVYGPARQLEHLDVSTPAVALRSDATGHDLLHDVDLPAEGDEAVYLVRRTDDRGRAEGAVAMTRVRRVGTALHRPAMRPIWPERAGWRPRIDQGQVHLLARWDRPMARARVREVSLLVEADGAEETTLLTVDVQAPADHLASPDAWEVRAAEALPAQQARYRWRYISDDGVVHHTPRSAWVRPATPANHSLTVWETR